MNSPVAVVFQHHRIPVINQRSVNCATQIFDGMHISFNPSSVDYGSKTTAIVLQQRVFFVLNGDHRAALTEAAHNAGAQGCIDYFIEKIAQANPLSEHRMVIGEVADPFEVTPTAIAVLGQANIDRLTQSAKILQQ
jgi:hypothetical protein